MGSMGSIFDSADDMGVGKDSNGNDMSMSKDDMARTARAMGKDSKGNDMSMGSLMSSRTETETSGTETET